MSPASRQVGLIFMDTGALYALADRRDPAHDRAKEFHAEAGRPYLLTDFVFAETMSLLTKRVGKKPAVAFGAGVRASARFRIEEPSADVREAAWKEFSGRIDKDHDLIDCLSFAMMEAYGLKDVFGFDRHFAQRGFRLVPA